jgi:topoisomerase IV subunit A
MSRKKTPPAPPSAPTIPTIEEPFADALSSRYLTYALSTIMARSLPDVRDGLKPVHRRLLWAMRLLKLDPDTGYKKCARVVGDVIGKYHPHGDQSVYDALVRLAQTFSVRYPLIDGQGNFGNIDGDNAAAMRYTEARLTRVAADMMDGLDEDSVGFRDNYDGSEEEPEVMPGIFPNLLANGAAGIAVGMATSIPPHNAAELIAGFSVLLDHPETPVSELMKLIPGPDFPTGGIVVETPASLLNSYETGRGSIRLRARWKVEEQTRGAWLIVIEDIPFQVQKSKLIEDIADLIATKKLPILEDVRDESTEDVRLILEPKSRSVDPAVLMESLFKLTSLETRFSLNLNVLDKNRTPRLMNLQQAMLAFLDHQFEVLRRRTEHRLSKIDDRLEMLGGYLIAYLNLDEVIRIIREEDEPKQDLMRAFELTDRQAEAILNMRLRSLRKLEEIELRREEKNLRAERKGLKDLLGSDSAQRARVKSDLNNLLVKYGEATLIGKRRTTFADMPTVAEISLESMIDKEPVTIICSEKGWIRALKGHVSLDDEQKFKDGDSARFAFHAQTTDKIMIVGDNGKFFTVLADRLPGGRGFGDPLRLIVDLDANAEIVALFVHVSGTHYLVAASDGRGFLVEGNECIAQTKSGKQILSPKDKAKLRVVVAATGDHVAVVGDNRKMLIFPIADLPTMTRGQGVMLQKYKDGGMADATVFTLENGLSWPMGGSTGRTRTETNLADWIGERSQAGRLPPAGFPKSNSFKG